MRFTYVILSAALCFAAGTVRADQAVKPDDAALIQAAEQMLKDDAKAAPTAAAAAPAVEAPTKTAPTNKAMNKEAEAPLFPAVKTQANETSLWWRLILSLAFIGAIGGAFLFAAKRWGRPNNKGGDRVRIEMLHQFHMGPRRSLALIRVAGEVMLIGVTDHSINMLKPVTLIDDELENLATKDFNNFLEDEFSIEDVRSALKARA